MKYTGMPSGMWLLYRKSFKNSLVSVLGYDKKRAERITKKAKQRYRWIIIKLPEFEKEDRFKTNIVNCAMLISFLQIMDKRPTVEKATDYYEKAMTNIPTKIFCKLRGKKKYSDKDIEGMKRTAKLNAADRNPYSWNMEFIPYEDGSGYEARFTKCGICALMKEYGFYDLTPAMCHLDYTMTEMSGVSRFVREYTLATGGPYCDCGYKKRGSYR